jgi:hypothetical protein
MTDEQWEKFNEMIRKLAETVHRMAVLLDDCLCDMFGFSRRPRGKHERK